MAIGRLARVAGCKLQTIRYYEEIGLMPPPPRTAGGQRRYPAAAVDRLRFIRHGRELGFDLNAIRELLSLTDRPESCCERADGIARTQLAAVERRIRRLEALRAELERMIQECTGGRVAECRVIEVLADHRHCLRHHHPEEAVPAAVDRNTSDPSSVHTASESRNRPTAQP
jgi:DNA-binding transcriptional MerR regulator